MWQVGGQVPHFEADTTAGTVVRYRELWQRRHLLLVTIAEPAAPRTSAYLDAVRALEPELAAHDTALVITASPPPGAPSPGIVVADRWGEIHHLAAGVRGAPPPPPELLAWLRYLWSQCPECQGESR